ncbi:tail fiber domain-containing protein, partial [Candidatus Woesearchaeota archaeon]|nr:tail fiber domain-containing protein [Candidatus Woesearchaeota archaeon]
TTATSLAADGANCAAGQYPLGVSATGAAQGCTADAVNDAVYSESTIQSVCTDCIDDAQIVNDGIDASSLAANSVDDSELVDEVYVPLGIRIGADSANNEIDDTSQGTGSTALYIGNQRITTEDIDSTGTDTTCDGQSCNVANTGTLDGIEAASFIRSDASDTMDAGTNTELIMLSDDTGTSTLSLYGAAQGTGRVYVGQTNLHGGGIEYSGDNSPVTAGAGSDYFALYRRNAGTNDWTARNFYNSNDWEFRGAITSTTINTGSGAKELGDAAVANGDTNSIPTSDQVYDFVTGQGYGTGTGTVTSIDSGTGLTGGPITTSGTLNIGGGTCITANANDVAITGNCISDTQLSFNTGQHLTTSSNPQFTDLTLSGSTLISSAGSEDTYGSITIDGSKNAYSGIHFKDVTGSGDILMVHNSGGIQGFWDASGGWDWYFANGVLTAGTVPWGRVTGFTGDTSPDSGTVSSITAGTGLTGGTITTSGTLTFDCSDVAGNGITCSGENIQADCTTILGHACGSDNVNDADASATNEIQNLFQTVNAPSGTDPAADASTDTLNLAAGGIVSITGDSGTDTITISATEVGDITGVTAGAGLSGGGTTDAPTLSLDTTGCLANEILKRNALNNAWECVADAGGSTPTLHQVTTAGSTTTNAVTIDSNGDEDTTIGGGLAVDGTTFNVDEDNNRVGIGTATPSATLAIGSAGLSGSAVYAIGSTRGGHFTANSATDTTTYGIYGLSTGTGGTTHYGGYFLGQGAATSYGVNAVAGQSAGNRVGVFGRSTYGLTYDIIGIWGHIGNAMSVPTGAFYSGYFTGAPVKIGDSGTISTATGDGDLYVEDDIEVDGMGTGAGTNVIIDQNGILLKDSSSKRYKENITDYEINIKNINNLRPVSFTYNNITGSPGSQSFGLIAEEVVEVFPELVEFNAEGQPESVHYSKLAVILLKDNQDKQKQIDELKTLVCLDHPDASICAN